MRDIAGIGDKKGEEDGARPQFGRHQERNVVNGARVSKGTGFSGEWHQVETV